MGLNDLLESPSEGSLPERLEAAGYSAEASEGGLIVKSSFAMGENKNLEVTVSVAASGEAEILGWQSVPVYTGK
jgi:hypothetical protein